ncbi:hypothetical protein [Acetoanaerobium noterae]|uniref:hypothetical protein n=1 Tax=Acetoanaerobium noterae TaxID=745369 RepID=UPI0032425FB6
MIKMGIFLIGLISGLVIHNAAVRIINFNASTDAWVSFYGAIGGGIITFLGVLLSLEHNKKMIKESFEQEQIAKMRPWIKLDEYKSNVLLTHSENEGTLIIYSTEDYERKLANLEREIYEFGSRDMQRVKDIIRINGMYVFHVIENLSDNPLLSSDYVLTFTTKDNKIEQLKVNIGDMKGKTKIFIPLPDQGKSKYEINSLEIKGKSIYNEEMFYKEKYINGCPVTVDITHNRQSDNFNRDLKSYNCIYITKESNIEFMKKFINEQ